MVMHYIETWTSGVLGTPLVAVCQACDWQFASEDRGAVETAMAEHRAATS